MFDLLFRPFDLARYALFVLIAFLAQCGTPSANLNTGSYDVPAMGDLDSASEMMIFGATTGGLLMLGLVVAVVGMVFWSALLFVSSRFQLMLIDGIATGEPDFQAWNRLGEQGNALFRFRLVLYLASAALVVVGMLVVATTQLGIGLISGDVGFAVAAQSLMSMTTLVLLLPIAFIVWVADWVAVDLAAPVLYAGVGQGSVRSGVSGLFAAERFEGIELLAFGLVRIVISVVLDLFVVLPLSCLCFCAMLIPGVSTAVFLPLIVFERGLSMQWIGRLDDRFAVLLGPTTDQHGG